MTQSFRKRLLKMETYIDKNAIKHNHNYCLKHLLIVTNINKHATANYYGKKEYYYVLKCNSCNSFIPDIVEGNYYHNVFNPDEIDYELPIITANTIRKCPHYSFSKLIDVSVDKNNNKGDLYDRN